MLTVGLTGGYATGKSSIAAEFERLGARVIHADALGRQALDRGGVAHDNVIREFGPGIVQSDGEIDRKRLAAIVFPNPEQLARLNALIHPYVFRQEQALIAQYGALDAAAIVVVEAAIMIEVGSYTRYDKLVVANCPEAMQIERAMRRDGISESEVRARLARQMPMPEKLKLADYVVDTSGPKEQAIAQTRTIWKELSEENARRLMAASAGA